MSYVVSNTGAEQKIAALEPFQNKTGSWWAKPGPASSVGHLPEKYWNAARDAVYTVYSYATPVGWVTQNGYKIVPDVGYSLSTGQHQRGTMHAWGMPRFPARGRTLAPAGTGARRGGIDD